MSYRKIIIIILFVSLIVTGGALALATKAQCSSPDGLIVDFGCYDFKDQTLQPLFWSFLPLLVISPVLFFARRETFIVWAKFAVPAFIAMLAIIFYTYNNEPIIGGWVSFGSDDQLATVLGPSLFFLISLVIIAVNSYRLRQA